MPITFTIGDELATQVEPCEAQLGQIVALGLREFRAQNEAGYGGVRDVLERLAALPAPEEVMALRPAPALQERIEALLERNRTSVLTADEQREWDHYQDLEHLVRLAKASALRKVTRRKNGA
jgi:hypothetical protein